MNANIVIKLNNNFERISFNSGRTENPWVWDDKQADKHKCFETASQAVEAAINSLATRERERINLEIQRGREAQSVLSRLY